MTDLASLGLRIESQQADAATAAMDKMAASADRAERATDGLSAGSAKADGAIAAMLASIDRTTREMLELSKVHQQAGGAALVQAGATEKLATEMTQASTAGVRFYSSFKIQQSAMEGAAGAARDYAAAVGAGTRSIGANDAHMVAYRAHLKGVQADSRATVREGLNLSRQFADIGVTAAMGMNPLMIAIQQGPQLLDIFQEKAIRTNTTVRVAFMGTATAAWAAVAPFMPLIAAVTAVAAVVAGSWMLATRAQTKEIGDLTAGMGLNEAQLKRLKDENVATTATAGDVWRGLGTTIKEVFVSVFGDQLDWVDKQWNSFLDDATAVAGKSVDFIAGAFVGAYRVVATTWKLLPEALGDAAVSSANAAITAINWLVAKSVEGINSLRAQYNSLPAWMRGGQAAPMIGASQMGTLANPYAGGMNRLDAGNAAAFGSGIADMRGASGRFMDTWRQNTRDSGRARVREGAGEAGSESGGGTDAGPRAREAQEYVEVMREVAALNFKPSNAQLELQLTILRANAVELELINNLARDSAQGLASAFGESGRAMGDLLTIMTDYRSRLNGIALAERENQISATQADRERAHAQIANYGDMLGAAKGFFEEGSNGYRALQAAEAAYRVFQFAMSVQAMAQNAAETGVSVGGSLARGAASAAAGAAKMFEALGPLAFPVVGAMLALLASIGLKGGGGGGGKSGGAANDNAVSDSVNRSQGQSAQQDRAQQSLFTSVAQRVEVKVTADRDGLNAYVVQTAADTARPMVEGGMAAAGGATRAQVMQDLDAGRTYSRSGG